MSRFRMSRVAVVALLTASVAASVWVYLAGGPQALEQIRSANPLAVIAGLMITAFCVFIRFLRWQFLLRRLDIRIPIRPSLSMYLASLVGMATPAYIGEVIRVVFMNRRFEVPYLRALIALLFERLLDFAAIALIALVVADTWLMRELLVGGLVLCYVASLVLSAAARGIGVPEKTLQQLRAPSSIIPALGISVVAWSAAGLLVSISAYAFGLSIGVLDSIRIFATSTLVGGLSLMPAGAIFAGGSAILQLQATGLATADSVTIVSLMRMMSVGATFLLSGVFVGFQLVRMRSGAAATPLHFDEISEEYSDQFRDHVWNYLLNRRIGFMEAALPTSPAESGVGLDLGCGLGLQHAEMTRRGYKVIGMDMSRDLLARAAANDRMVLAGSALELPFPDESVDYVYCVGVLHHLPGPDAQQTAIEEVQRVLRPGGYFMIQESNPWNPIFRFYMGYVFPILKTIDEGTEYWIHPRKWEDIPGMNLVGVDHFTFLPDFTPGALMKGVVEIEHLLEESRLRNYSVHYMATLIKEGSGWQVKP